VGSQQASQHAKLIRDRSSDPLWKFPCSFGAQATWLFTTLY
jgi:hypothetical protein